jgi:hypothetical protein
MQINTNMLIGDRPYEEAIPDLVCPPKLGDKWKEIWNGVTKGRNKLPAVSKASCLIMYV